MSMNKINFTNIRLTHITAGGVVEILHNIDIALFPGKVLAVLGESGAGKSFLARSLCALAGRNDFIPPGFFLNGQVTRADIFPAMIFQNVKTCLNPSLRVGAHLKEILRYRQPPPAFASPENLLELVNLPPGRSFQQQYPHELSGGMQQRLAVACAIAADADILIADEALTALDRETARNVLSVFGTIARELHKAVVLITHNLRILQECADRVAVMYSGYLVEEGRADIFLKEPRHPYSRALMESRPSGQQKGRLLNEIEGDISPAGQSFAGCPFAPRCQYQQEDCRTRLPPMRFNADGDADGDADAAASASTDVDAAADTAAKADAGSRNRYRCFHPFPFPGVGRE
ncbi:MAG: oligopeptide/dipeptide ABC transporter ATP-binding protein [Salinispira sp.]